MVKYHIPLIKKQEKIVEFSEGVLNEINRIC